MAVAIFTMVWSAGQAFCQTAPPGGGPGEPGPDEQRQMMTDENAGDMRFFVTGMGIESGIGTRHDPFGSIEQARDHIRQLRAEGKVTGTVFVWLMGGVYMIEHTIVFDERDAGTNDTAVIFEPAPGNPVLLMGGPFFTLGMFPKVKDAAILERLDPSVRDSVYEIDLRGMMGFNDFGEIGPRGPGRPYLPAPVELFFNSEPMTLARWPNAGEKMVPVGEVVDAGSKPREGDSSDRGGVFRYDGDRPRRWIPSMDDLWIAGCFNHGNAWDVVKVASIDVEKRTLNTAHPVMDGFESGKAWQAWYAMNILEELDSPGEYYIDRASGKAYLIPPEDDPNAAVSISKLDGPLLSFEGASYIMFRGVTFELSRGSGVHIEGGRNIKMLGCAIRNVGSVGVSVGQGIAPLDKFTYSGTGTPISQALGSWHEHLHANPTWDRLAGRFHEIEDCDIYNTGAGGVMLGGGNRVSGELGANILRNSNIHNFNRWERTYRAGVNIDGAGNVVVNSAIHDCPGSALYMHGSDHTIERNEFFNAAREVDDHGVVYLGGDPSEFYNTFRYNYFHDCGSDISTNTATIYLDDGACGIQLLANTFRNVRGQLGAIFIDGGGFNLIENNVFINCDITLRHTNWPADLWKSFLESDLIKARLTQHVDIRGDDQKKRYPDLATLYDTMEDGAPLNTFNRNVFSNSGPMVGGAVKASNLHFAWDGLDLANPEDITQGYPEGSIPNTAPDWVDMQLDRTGLYRTPGRTRLPGEPAIADPAATAAPGPAGPGPAAGPGGPMGPGGPDGPGQVGPGGPSGSPGNPFGPGGGIMPEPGMPGGAPFAPAPRADGGP